MPGANRPAPLPGGGSRGEAGVRPVRISIEEPTDDLSRPIAVFRYGSVTMARSDPAARDGVDRRHGPRGGRVWLTSSYQQNGVGPYGFGMNFSVNTRSLTGHEGRPPHPLPYGISRLGRYWFPKSPLELGRLPQCSGARYRRTLSCGTTSPVNWHESLIFHVVESIIADNADVVGRLGAKVTHRTQVGDDVTHSWIIPHAGPSELEGPGAACRKSTGATTRSRLSSRVPVATDRS